MWVDADFPPFPLSSYPPLLILCYYLPHCCRALLHPFVSPETQKRPMLDWMELDHK